MIIHTYHSAFKRLTAVKAMPAGSRPPAADDSVRISTGGRYGGFGASGPLLTKPSLMHFSGVKGSSAILPKLTNSTARICASVILVIILASWTPAVCLSMLPE